MVAPAQFLSGQSPLTGTTSSGGFIQPGAPAFAGIGNLPGSVVFSDSLPSTTFDPSHPFATPLYGGNVTGVDPSAGFLENLGGPTASPLGGTTITGVTTPGFDLPEVDVSSPVVTGGAGSGGSAPGAGSGTLPGDIPQQGGDYGGLNPDAVTGAPAVAGANNALAAVASWLTDKGLRFGLIALGILLVLVAAWGFVKGDVDTTKIAKAAAAA
jgi:hypothetical protein